MTEPKVVCKLFIRLAALPVWGLVRSEGARSGDEATIWSYDTVQYVRSGEEPVKDSYT